MPRRGILEQVRRRVLNLLFEEALPRRRPKRVAAYLLRLGMHMVQELGRDNCLQRAAALSFTTILSLVPVTALFVLYFKMAGKLAIVSGNLQEQILRLFVAEAAQGVISYIDQFVETLHTRALGTFGALGMVFVAYSLFRTVEKSLNGIWKVSSLRTFVARFQILASLLVVIPIFLVASFYLSGKLHGLKILGQYGDVTLLARSLLVAMPFFLTATSFCVLFVFVPNTKVRWRSAFLAALVSAVLFETAKQGFNLYVVRVIPYSKIYGTLGLFPVLMLWIYVSWIITLFGVEFSYTVQNLRGLHDEELQRRKHHPFSIPVHEEWGQRIFGALLKCFQTKNGPVAIDSISEEIGLSIPQVENHLQILLDEQIVGVITDNEGEKGYVPTRPLESLTVGDVSNVFRKRLGLPPDQSRKAQENVAVLTTAPGGEGTAQK